MTVWLLEKEIEYMGGYTVGVFSTAELAMAAGDKCHKSKAKWRGSVEGGYYKSLPYGESLNVEPIELDAYDA